MKIKYCLLLLLLLFISINSGSKVIYINPCDGAKLVNTENNIIIGFDIGITLNKIDILKFIKVEGTKSGLHPGKISITGDKKRIIYSPETYFAPGETVTVTVSGSLARAISKEKTFSFNFETSSVKPEWNRLQILADELGVDINMINNPVFDNPPVIPALTVTINNNPENGNIFLGNFPLGIYQPYLMITDKSGALYYYQQRLGMNTDFKKQPNGNLTFYDKGADKFLELNSSYNLIDTFYTGNGYETDEHELRILSNGHALLMSYDPQIVDMSQIVPGGRTNATVIGLIIQEIDENKNVVFQWRSWDHFLITDALHENLTALLIDYVHGNAIEIDNDSNLIISSRHLDEITKINRTTGAVMWRWGGKNNQFTFIDDTLHFTYQHAIRRIANGNLTMYDNGNFHTPKFSRALEYTLDEVNRTATLVWEYRHNPPIFGSAMGYVQRLPGGNTLIGWGAANTTITEVTPEKTVVLEMRLPPNVYTYRVYKNEWNGAPTSGGNGNGTIPKEFSLSQNYPNPFNPATTINFELPEAAHTNLTVYDITGRLVETIVSENLNAGIYSYVFEGSKYASGVYFYTLSAGGFILNKKMILVK